MSNYMHEHEGLFCKTTILRIIAKIATEEKNMHRAESGANGPTGAGVGGSSPMGYGPVLH